MQSGVLIAETGETDRGEAPKKVHSGWERVLWPLFTRILTVTLLRIYEGILTPIRMSLVGPGS